MRHSLFFLFYVLICSVTSAQRRETVIVRKYTQKDGINSYNVRRVTEDEFGFIWVATQDGLSRYDGRNFVGYTKSAESRHRLCGIDIREVIPDSADHLLWVLPGEVGVNVINTLTGNVIRTIPIPHSTSEDWNICMVKDRDLLWIGTFTGIKLYNIRSGSFETLPPLAADGANPVEYEVRSVLKDNNGNIWVAYSGYGIVVYDGRTKALLGKIGVAALNDHLKSRSIRFVSGVESHAGSILYATNQGLRRISYDKSYRLLPDNNPCTAVVPLNTEEVDYVAVRKEDVLVAGHGGLRQFDEGLKKFTALEEHMGMADNKWLDAVQCIFIDGKDNIWLGCQEGLGFISNQKSPFDAFAYDEASHIKLDNVRTICALPDGDILAGLMNGLVRIDQDSRRLTLYERTHTYDHIFQDGNNRIITSRTDGLFILQKDGSQAPIVSVYPEFSNYARYYINSHLRVNDTLVILGTENNNGILLWNPVRKKVWQIGKGKAPNALSSNIVNNIYRDAARNLWVLSDNVISILSPDLSISRELVLPYKLFFDMCEAGGYYWLASYGSGIIQLDKSFRVKNVLNTSNGLSNDGVYQLYPIGGDRLLVTTNNGLSLLDLHTLAFRNYFAGDGLHSNGFEEVCGVRAGGLIYAGGLNGFTVIDPLRFSTNTMPPTLYFTGVRTQMAGRLVDTADLSMISLVIPNNWLQTNVSFAGLNFSRPEAVRYKYRILQQDSTWVSLGSQSGINLIGLPPGVYTLEVKAANEDGYWSAPVKMTLHFQPKWYETWWFRVSVVLAVLSLLYGFYRFRIGEIRKQQQIRSGIASDLHDDIGSLLNSVKVFSHLAKKEPSQDEHFLNIDESLTQATTGLRDMIWVLDNSEDTFYELIGRIKKYALPVAGACGVRLNWVVDLPEKDIPISKTEKRNLLLIAKEAINNSLKYSACRTITVECNNNRNVLTLRIADDGKGFDMRQPSSGNGLRNMAERARQMRYHCSITAAPGKGVRIEISKG